KDFIKFKLASDQLVFKYNHSTYNVVCTSTHNYRRIDVGLQYRAWKKTVLEPTLDHRFPHFVRDGHHFRYSAAVGRALGEGSSWHLRGRCGNVSTSRCQCANSRL